MRSLEVQTLKNAVSIHHLVFLVLNFEKIRNLLCESSRLQTEKRAGYLGNPDS